MDPLKLLAPLSQQSNKFRASYHRYLSISLFLKVNTTASERLNIIIGGIFILIILLPCWRLLKITHSPLTPTLKASVLVVIIWTGRTLSKLLLLLLLYVIGIGYIWSVGVADALKKNRSWNQMHCEFRDHITYSLSTILKKRYCLFSENKIPPSPRSSENLR